MKQGIFYLAVAFVLSCSFFVPSADAASFDCKEAKRPPEKLICNNPELSKLDEKLDEAYKRARVDLSEAAQKVIAEGQRSWLRTWPKACGIDGKNSKLESDPTSCVITKYKERIDSLLNGRYTLPGGVQVYPVVRYFLHSRKSTKYAFHETSYPQIDTANQKDPWDKFAKNLNDWIFSRFDPFLHIFKSHDTQYRITLETLARDFIGLKTSLMSYPHGSKEGPHETAFFLSIDVPDIKEVNASDIFKGNAWPDVFAQYIANTLNNDKACTYSDTKKLARAIRDTKRWWFVEKGLQVNLPEALNNCEITKAIIPRKVLYPHMTGFAKAADIKWPTIDVIPAKNLKDFWGMEFPTEGARPEATMWTSLYLNPAGELIAQFSYSGETKVPGTMLWNNLLYNVAQKRVIHSEKEIYKDDQKYTETEQDRLIKENEFVEVNKIRLKPGDATERYGYIYTTPGYRWIDITGGDSCRPDMDSEIWVQDLTGKLIAKKTILYTSHKKIWHYSAPTCEWEGNGSPIPRKVTTETLSVGDVWRIDDDTVLIATFKAPYLIRLTHTLTSPFVEKHPDIRFFKVGVLTPLRDKILMERLDKINPNEDLHVVVDKILFDLIEKFGERLTIDSILQAQ